MLTTLSIVALDQGKFTPAPAHERPDPVPAPAAAAWRWRSVLQVLSALRPAGHAWGGTEWARGRPLTVAAIAFAAR
jgi:hypothetical protein